MDKILFVIALMIMFISIFMGIGAFVNDLSVGVDDIIKKITLYNNSFFFEYF